MKPISYYDQMTVGTNPYCMIRVRVQLETPEEFNLFGHLADKKGVADIYKYGVRYTSNGTPFEGGLRKEWKALVKHLGGIDPITWAWKELEMKPKLKDAR